MHANTSEVAYIYTKADTFQLRTAAPRRSTGTAVFCIANQHLHRQLDERRQPIRASSSPSMLGLLVEMANSSTARTRDARNQITQLEAPTLALVVR
jgi:hypothetical protein